MSSAILYAAIVAIWALVLVPRWLRPRHHASRALASRLTEPAGPARPEDLAWADEGETGQDEYTGSFGDGYAGSFGEMDQMRAETGAGRADRGTGPPAADERASILRARRRALITLLLLTGGAVGIAVTHIAANWVVIPPGAMLAGYVLLLREAGRSDARHARAIAARQRAGSGAAGRPAPAGTAGDVATEPGAQIIDISARVGDQLYDQYADAAARAVGD